MYVDAANEVVLLHKNNHGLKCRSIILLEIRMHTVLCTLTYHQLIYLRDHVAKIIPLDISIYGDQKLNSKFQWRD